MKIIIFTPSVSIIRHGILYATLFIQMVWTTSHFAHGEDAIAANKEGSIGVERDAQTGEESSDSHVISDLELKLLWVKSGSFTMGSDLDEPFRNVAEGPQTEVTISQGFWLGMTEVTQAQFEAIMGINPSAFKAVGEDAPVERVSWIDAMEFCQILTERELAAGRLPEGYEFTLPTEAQWEYAYRAGTTGTYPGDPEAMAWHEKNSGGETHPVAQKEPNVWGFYDMPGNVLEWCYDWYDEAYLGGEVTDPVGPEHGYFRMARGGSWRVDIKAGRSAARSGGSSGRRDYTIGFRLVLSPAR